MMKRMSIILCALLICASAPGFALDSGGACDKFKKTSDIESCEKGYLHGYNCEPSNGSQSYAYKKGFNAGREAFLKGKYNDTSVRELISRAAEDPKVMSEFRDSGDSCLSLISEIAESFVPDTEVNNTVPKIHIPSFDNSESDTKSSLSPAKGFSVIEDSEK